MSNVYGLDDFPAEYVRVLDGELNMEKWKSWNRRVCNTAADDE